MNKSNYKQVEWFYDASNFVTRKACDGLYRVEMRCPPKLLDARSFVLIPRHQSIIDIPSEGKFLKEKLDRRAYYLMKASIPRPFRDLLEYYGGIIVNRRKDLDPSLPEEEKNRLSELEKDRVDRIIAELLDYGNIVVDHIEGTRSKHFGDPFRIRYDVIKRLVGLNTKEDPVFASLNMKYSNRAKFGSNIIITAGEPIATRNAKTLEDYLKSSFNLI